MINYPESQGRKQFYKENNPKSKSLYFEYLVAKFYQIEKEMSHK